MKSSSFLSFFQSVDLVVLVLAAVVLAAVALAS